MPREERHKVRLIATPRRFPADREAVKKLFIHDDDFHDMCEELALAEEALREVEGLPLGIRAERTAEWNADIQHRVFEIARALREANVVQVGHSSTRKSLDDG